jgi:undecaprenyl-diphosphatase
MAWFFSLYKKDWRGHEDARLFWLIIVGSLPIVLLGLLLQKQIDRSFRDLRITATMLIVFGVILMVADRVGKQYRDS